VGDGVVGIDPSLTSTGLAHWAPGAGWDTTRIVTKGTNSDTYFQTERRLDRIVVGVGSFISNHGASLAVLEWPAYSSNTGHAADRAGLFWIIARSISREWPGVRLAYCDPRVRIKYALGKKVGSKDQVMAAAIKRYDDALIRNFDEADAVLLAAMGVRWKYNAGVWQWCTDKPPQACRDAVPMVQWPPTL
jgi:crossover junction endodeoxyribonuclease RuvC